ncbi:hypothetical protein EJ110_NYTH35202 [Nymphaea thermarum]|nr:hypothetical protein EJ110_NYTH35202 [Nymphaea thermarum]
MFRYKTFFFFFFILHLLISSSSSSSSSVVGKLCRPRLCGNLTVKHPFALERNCSSSSPSHVLVCHDQNLYLVLIDKGVIHVSAIDYDGESLGLGKYPLEQGKPKSGIWELKFGEVSSFTVPTHLPNVCEECTKPHGNCGIGLRCICYPKRCSKFPFHHQSSSSSSSSSEYIYANLFSSKEVVH